MKQKTKHKSKGASRSKAQAHYPAYLLAVVLAGVLMLEGLMLGASSPKAWQDGLQVLGMSQAIESVASDIGIISTPMMEQVGYINEFYQLAATELMVLLDFSGQDFMAGPKMAAEFYDKASVEIAKMIDFTGQAEYWPQVAGASLHR